MLTVINRSTSGRLPPKGRKSTPTSSLFEYRNEVVSKKIM